MSLPGPDQSIFKINSVAVVQSLLSAETFRDTQSLTKCFFSITPLPLLAYLSLFHDQANAFSTENNIVRGKLLGNLCDATYAKSPALCMVSQKEQC